MTTKKLVAYSIIGFILTALIIGTAFYFMAYKQVQKGPREIKTYSYSIGELYANVKDSRRILKVNMDVEVSVEELEEKLENKRSKIINSVLETLRGKTEEELAGDQGQKLLRKELLKCIQSVVPSDQILDVYFVEFIIQ